MSKKQILEELLKDDYKKENIIDYILANFSIGKIIVIVMSIFCFAIYTGNLLFGDNSLEVLLNLEIEKDFLSKEVEILKQDNAKLQKSYFELKELEP